MSTNDSTDGSPERHLRGCAVDLLDLGFRTPSAPPGCTDRGGDLISHYRLVAPLGEGGFGMVWSAVQTAPFEREVALKLIKRGMDSCEIIARFEAESQALARMDHPHIAAVLDAGTAADGRPFFAMELVRGSPLNTYCDLRRLSVRERLELFLPVCLAVQHAHQKSILHRDLKPSNILVVELDGRPVPKIIDFGIAKALGAPNEAALQGSLLQTRVGAVIGTLEYMSPEQAGSVPDVDTRSDIYSLGVILYELLTGQTPLAARSVTPASHEETLRRIREEEAARPSNRLVPESAGLRGTDPATLRRLLRGDLDCLVQKALEKDRRRRYETASALAADVERYLGEQPINAAPPTWSYQFSKFARRNRVAIATAGLIATTLVAGTVVSLWQASAARKAAAAAGTAEAAARTAAAAAQAHEARARNAVNRYLNEVGDDAHLRGEEFRGLRKSLLESAVPFYEELSKGNSDDPAILADRAFAFERLGTVYRETDEREKAVGALRQAAAIKEQLVAKFPGNQGYRMDLAAAYSNLGLVLRELKRSAEALPVLARSVEIAGQIMDAFPTANPGTPVLPLLNYGQAQADAGDIDGAEATMLRAVHLSENLVTEAHGTDAELGTVAFAYNSIASMLGLAGKFDRAEPYLRRTMKLREELVAAADSPPQRRAELAETLHNFSTWLWMSGRMDEALDLQQRCVELNATLVKRQPVNAESRLALATAQFSMGFYFAGMDRKDEAKVAFQESLACYRALVAEFPQNPGHLREAARTLGELGQLQRDIGDLPAAVASYLEGSQLLRHAVELRPDKVDDREALRNALRNLAETSLQTGELSAAMKAALEVPECAPASWKEYVWAAGMMAQAIPLLEKDPKLASDQVAREVKNATDEAINLLTRSIERGYPSPSNLEGDPRFARLGSDPRFLTLDERAPDPVDRSPVSFTLDYRHDDPGLRLWKREDEFWTETMPSGKVNRFTITRRLRVNRVSGTEIAAEGRSLWLFIPDTGTPAPSRLLVRTKPGQWGSLGEMAAVQ